MNILTSRLPEANYTPLKVRKMDKFMYNTAQGIELSKSVTKDNKESRFRS
jgi:hypothetical protein